MKTRLKRAESIFRDDIGSNRKIKIRKDYWRSMWNLLANLHNICYTHYYAEQSVQCTAADAVISMGAC